MPPIGFLIVSMLIGSAVGLLRFASLTRSSNAIRGTQLRGPDERLEPEAPLPTIHPPLQEAA